MADLVDTAVQNGAFTTLAAALQAAGLVDTLKGPGPFTVFAPTDAAFAKLPPGTVEGLLADPAQLTAVLTYHVVPGRVLAQDVLGLTAATTVQGQSLAIEAVRRASRSAAPPSSPPTSWPTTASSTSSTACSCPHDRLRHPGIAPYR